MITDAQWAQACLVVRRAVRSSLCCSIASTNPDGSPHVTPIGSVMLGDPGTAIYFEAFNKRLAANVDRDPNIAILAVDSRQRLWLPALMRGRFSATPGLRLLGRVAPVRAGTSDEIERFRRVVGPLLRTRGGAALWGSLDTVRDVEIDRIQPLDLGPMTHSWRATQPRARR
ncbi:pyridoxamine 5'-phosphate oxidase-related protein [Gordonia araii NBRC 100433]|uniref:Pyridoxamine 5'-phosphate oxidase-related protein n=1 Tax=Gordonia araii NBRC 100433 TaxID=1073574 RepID=G7H4T3_9ACTN|nr:pyridoxamine 5'-phosphate oxidase family protein [Gordonia araii]NNG98001.1 pyridoxamine 5'-phosphate oxidase family protein [Gordonia araii NBRC 100433]GAB10858.1 pyridoxamine 5'-phosphate oxidase-related protein [Gordonia araii NBRC 100433]